MFLRSKFATLKQGPGPSAVDPSRHPGLLVRKTALPALAKRCLSSWRPQGHATHTGSTLPTTGGSGDRPGQIDAQARQDGVREPASAHLHRRDGRVPLTEAKSFRGRILRKEPDHGALSQLASYPRERSLPASPPPSGGRVRPVAFRASPPVTTLRKIWSLLDPPQRWAVATLLSTMLIGMLFEMLGLGLVAPALAILSDGNVLQSPAVARWLVWLGSPSRTTALIVGLALILSLYLLKTVVLLLISWRQHLFVTDLNADLSQRLFATYLAQPWPFHLQRNSARLMRGLDNVSLITDSVAWVLILVAESLVLAGIVGLLLWWEPLGALAVGVVVIAATLFLDQITRGRILRWGSLRHQHALERGKLMQEGFHSVKETLALDRAGGMVARFAAANRSHARVSAKQHFIGQVPRLWYEFVAVAALATLAAVLMAEGKSARAMIPTLGLFAAAAFRVLPSVNRLATAVNTLRFNDAAVDAVCEDLALANPGTRQSSGQPMRFEAAVALEGVSFQYPSAATPALHDVSLTIPKGSAVGIVGTSGAGKSTIIDLLLGLLTPTSGRVSADGIDITTDPIGWRRLIGYVPQSMYLCDDTIRRNVAFGLPDDQIDDAAVQRALRAAQLESFIATLPDGADTVVGERGVRLSGGQRQRIAIARALYHDPQILLLDEATSALDEATEQEFLASVNELHYAKTLVIVTHRLSTVANCDIVYRIEAGRLIHAGRRPEQVSS